MKGSTLKRAPFAFLMVASLHACIHPPAVSTGVSETDTTWNVFFWSAHLSVLSDWSSSLSVCFDPLHFAPDVTSRLSSPQTIANTIDLSFTPDTATGPETLNSKTIP